MNQQLTNFVKNQLSAGKKRDEIKSILINQGGWTEKEVEDVFTQINIPANIPKPVIENDEPRILRNEDKTNVGLYQPGKRPRMNWATTAILAVIFVLLFGGAAWAMVKYFPNLLRPVPEEVLNKTFLSLEELKTAHYEGAFSAKGTILMPMAVNASSTNGSSTAGSYDVKVTFSGDMDRTDNDNPKVILSITPDVKIKMPPITFDITATIDSRAVDRIVYVQLKSITDLMLPFDLARFKGKWIKLESDDAQNQGLSISQFNREKIAAVLKETPIIKITEELKDEKIDGLKAYHYKFTVEKEVLAKLIEDKESKRQLSEMTMPAGEIWISKDDFIPVKVKFNYQMKSENINGTVEGEIRLFKANEPISITAPEGALTFNELMGELFPQMTDTGTTSTSTETRGR